MRMPKTLTMKFMEIKSSIKSLILMLVLFFVGTTVQAQATNPDFFQSIGKIYVVVVIVVSIFIGIVLFMWNLERRLKKLENQIEK